LKQKKYLTQRNKVIGKIELNKQDALKLYHFNKYEIFFIFVFHKKTEMTHILNPRLIADVFDEDVIIANLDTGTYYSLSGVATQILGELPFQDSSKVFNEIANKLQENSNEVISELNEYFKRMQDEEVIIVADSEAKSKKVTLKEPLKYMKSEFSTYTDLQELLLLDPIHEIDEDEWKVSDGKK